VTSVGLVGTGYWAETIHGPSIAAAVGLSGRAIWGRDATERARLAGRLGLHACDSFAELVASVDVVDLAVAPAAQVDLAIAAAATGRHLLLEKPMAVELAEARRLDSAIAAAGVSAVVFLSRLFDDVRSAWLAEQARAGHRRGRVRWISAALSAGSPYARSAWRREGGALWDVGPHILSQLTTVLGPVVGVRVHVYDPRAVSRLSLRHRDGAVSDVEMTLYADPGDKQEAFEFEGPGGRATLPDQPLDFQASHGRALAALLGHASRGPVPAEDPTSAHAGVEMTRLLERIEEVGRSGTWGVYVSLEDPA
jgi:predicted dehydrogenase